MKILLPIAVMFVLVGCSNTDSYMDTNYPGIDDVKHSHDGFPYLIRDNPNRKSLTVFAVSTSERTNITFNGLFFDYDPVPPQILEAASQDYLTKRSKGSCAIGKGYPIGSPYLRYEFFYDCKGVIKKPNIVLPAVKKNNLNAKKAQPSSGNIGEDNTGLAVSPKKSENSCEKESQIDFKRDRGKLEMVLADSLGRDGSRVQQFYEFKSIEQRGVECGKIDLFVRYSMESLGGAGFGIENISRRVVLLKEDGRFKIGHMSKQD